MYIYHRFCSPLILAIDMGEKVCLKSEDFFAVPSFLNTVYSPERFQCFSFDVLVYLFISWYFSPMKKLYASTYL